MKKIKLPFRLSWHPIAMEGRFHAVIPGRGEAGWAVAEMTIAEAKRFMSEYPEAAMPCWKRMMPGGDLYVREGWEAAS